MLVGDPSCQGTLGEGPWHASLWVRLDTAVLSKSNYRHRSRSRGAMDWGKLRTFDELTSLSVRAARPADWLPADPAVPVARRPRLVSVMVARTTLDAGNVSKSILDSCQGIVMATDAEVVAVSEVVTRSRLNPGAVIAFAQFPGGCALSDVTASLPECVRAAVSLPAAQALLADRAADGGQSARA